MSSEQEWQIATAEFLNTPEGRNWDGSPNARELVGYLLTVNGLSDAEDKVAALKSVTQEMHNRGLDVVPEKKMVVNADASPGEILKSWKIGYGNDPVKIGEAFRKFFTM